MKVQWIQNSTKNSQHDTQALHSSTPRLNMLSKCNTFWINKPVSFLCKPIKTMMRNYPYNLPWWKVWGFFLWWLCLESIYHKIDMSTLTTLMQLNSTCQLNWSCTCKKSSNIADCSIRHKQRFSARIWRARACFWQHLELIRTLTMYMKLRSGWKALDLGTVCSRLLQKTALESFALFFLQICQDHPPLWM